MEESLWRREQPSTSCMQILQIAWQACRELKTSELNARGRRRQELPSIKTPSYLSKVCSQRKGNTFTEHLLDDSPPRWSEVGGSKMVVQKCYSCIAVSLEADEGGVDKANHSKSMAESRGCDDTQGKRCLKHQPIPADQSPGFSGCLEHTNVIWYQIQSAKWNGRDLHVLFLDLANASESVPHSLIWAAFDFFHVPKNITDLVRNYFQDLQFCVTTAEYETSWQLLEVRVMAGCT